MTLKKNIPFQNMSSRQWENLGLAALFIFYFIQVGFDLLWRNTCGHLAIDYCAFLSAGRIANTTGYADVYDIAILGQAQSGIMPHSSEISTFVVSPVAYLPIFIMPFQLFSLLAPLPSFVLWTLFNAGVLFIYMRFFIKKTTGQALQAHLLVLFALSLPVYWNFFNGQVNVWLVVCVGEFMRAAMNGKPFRAGLWMGGLLIKPQILILIGAALLLQRSFKLLAGFATASAALFVISFFLLGHKGMQQLVDLWLGFAGGLPTNDVEIMMNWRMIGLYLSNISFPLFERVITGMGMTATLLAAAYIWRKPLNFHSTNFAAALLGLLSATGLFAWHSHIHTAMMLIPPIAYLLTQKQLPYNAFIRWVFVPAVIYTAAFLFAAVIQAGLLPANVSGLPDLFRGTSGFGANVLLLAWTVKYLFQNHHSSFRTS
jgi:hypothetical protein